MRLLRVLPLLFLAAAALVAGGCGDEPDPTTIEEGQQVQMRIGDMQIAEYKPAPITIIAADKDEKDRLQKLIERLTTTLHDDVKWEIIEYGPRAIDMLIEGCKRGEETQMRKDTTRAFIQHDMGDACDGLLREMIVYHSNYAGEDLPKRGDYRGWMEWWGKHRNDVFFYSPNAAERVAGTALARH
ncbi:MAG TPA: hypothetical protein VL860_08860 [Planctomycetota bacterium]|nr:hypothetical protein [Planctomycetota bacterium]